MGEANGVASGMMGGKTLVGDAPLGAALRAGEALNALSATLTRAAPSLAPTAEAARTHLTAAWGAARPWGEFFDRRKFVPPTGGGELRERLVDNLQYFTANYIVCFLMVSALSVLVHPFSFLAVLFVGGVYFWLFVTNTEGARLGPLAIPKGAKLPLFGVFALAILYLTNAVAALGSWALFAVLCSFAHAGARVSAKEPDFESPVEPV